MIHRLPRWVMVGAVVLAFSAGFVNAVALLGFASNAVSHVTGTVSMAAAAVVELDGALLYHTAMIVLAFFLGAILSGLLVKNESLKLGRSYGLALLVEALLLYLAIVFFMKQNFIGELLASAACGLQNAMIATYSGSVIRTTHLTGIVSDLGSAIGSRLAGVRLNSAQILLQSSIFVSFFAGSVVGSLGFARYSYLAFLLPATIILLAAVAYAAMCMVMAWRRQHPL